MHRLFVLLLIALPVLAQTAPVRILIAYHSATGNTEKLAKAIQAGASLPGVEITLRKLPDPKLDDIVSYDGIVLGSPVHWSNMSADTKRFLEGIGNALWNAKTTGDGRTAAAFCTGGHPSMGKEVVRMSILSAFLTMRFVVVGGVEAEGFGTLGPEATTGPLDPGISEKELAEARKFGERFARITRQLRQAR